MPGRIDVQILVHSIFAYITLCALFIASPVKATPAMWLAGFSLARADNGGAPSFLNALKFMILSDTFLPLFCCAVYLLSAGFLVGISEMWGFFILSGAMWSISKLIDIFYLPELIWNEQISDLRYVFTEKHIEKLNKKSAKGHKWNYRLYDAYERFVYKTKLPHLSSILVLAVTVFFGVNLMRQGQAPVDYDDYVYNRPAVEWQNNAYFALLGINAPYEIEDSYAYGQKKASIGAHRYNEAKRSLGIGYLDAIPKIEPLPYAAGDDKTELKFQDGLVDNLMCVYRLDANKAAGTCPTDQDVLRLIDINKKQWSRFQAAPDYDNFSIPDTILTKDHSADLKLKFFKLAQVKAAEIIILQKQGQDERAFEEWQCYMRLYIEMLRSSSSSVHKMQFLVSVQMQSQVLESLLFNNPRLAKKYEKEISNIMALGDASDFSMRDVLVVDWRSAELLVLYALGEMPLQKRKIYSCLQEYKAVANLSAKQYFARGKKPLCVDQYPPYGRALLINSILEPGEPMGNFIYNIFMPDFINGRDVVSYFHYEMASSRMMQLAARILNADIDSDQLPAYLASLPQAYLNPITEEPFSWDAELQQLFYSYKNRKGKTQRRSVQLNLKR